MLLCRLNYTQVINRIFTGRHVPNNGMVTVKSLGIAISWVLLATASMIIDSASAGEISAKKAQIKDFIRNNSELSFVTLTAGTQQGFIKDTLLLSQRPTSNQGNDQSLITTGRLRVISASEQQAIAVILEDGNELSKSIFGRYPGVMVGDFISIDQPKIEYATQVTPVIQLLYRDLFVDPLESPHTYELSEEGKKKLKDAMSYFADAKVPLVMIEGHTDDKGSQESNQIESYQRALTVQQYVIGELKYNPDRVSSVGLGESDFNATAYLPEYRQNARRIVIKAIGTPPP